MSFVYSFDMNNYLLKKQIIEFVLPAKSEHLNNILFTISTLLHYKYIHPLPLVPFMQLLTKFTGEKCCDKTYYN